MSNQLINADPQTARGPVITTLTLLMNAYGMKRNNSDKDIKEKAKTKLHKSKEITALKTTAIKATALKDKRNYMS